MTGGVATANEDLSPGRFSPSGVHPHPLELAHEIVLFSRVNYSSVCKCFGGNKTSALIQGHEDVLADSTLKRSSHISFHQIPIWESEWLISEKLRLSHFFVLCSFITPHKRTITLSSSLSSCQPDLFSLRVTRGCFVTALVLFCHTSVAPFALRHV